MDSVTAAALRARPVVCRGAATMGHEKLGITIASGSGLALVAGVVARMFLGKQSKLPEVTRGPKVIEKRR